MPRSKPTTVAPGIYRRAKCYEARVFIGGDARYLVEYFPLDTPLETMQTWQRDHRLVKDQHRRLEASTVTNAERGTLDADLVRVLPQLEGRVSFKADRSHLRACLATVVPRDPARPKVTCRLGELPRQVVTTEHINSAIASWRRLPAARSVRTIQVAAYTRPTRDGDVATLDGYTRRTPIASAAIVAVKTIRHRCRVLAELYHVLDGHTRVGRGPRARWFTAAGQLASTPVDAAKIPAVESPHPIDVDIETVRAVAAQLAAAIQPRTPARPPRNLEAWQQHEAARRLEAYRTYARFLVLATTGQRACQLQRALPGDLDLDVVRLWTVRAAKNEPAHPITLNDEMVAAWRLFIDADAWGWYDTSKHAKRVHEAGWPATVRPYNARHAVMIAAIRAGVPLGDVQGLAGHATPDTTRRFYAPFVIERQRVVSDQLNGRLADAFRPHVVPSQNAVTGAPVAPPLSDRQADRPAAAPLALVPPAPARRRRKADAR